MSAVQAGGGKGGSGQRTAAQSGKAGTKGARNTPQGRQPRPSGGAPGAKGKAGKTIEAPPPRRLSPSTMAFIAVGVVVAVILVFVIVKVTGGGSSSTNNASTAETAADPVVVAKLTGVTPVTANTVAVPSSVLKPQVVQGQQPLIINGKPAVVYIGADFCPYCAAERWGMILALSRFGTFSGLRFQTSSPWDVHPATATFSFHGSSYSSQYITFDAKEYQGNDTTGPGTHTILMPLTTQEQQLWSKWSAHFGQNEGFPFVNIANKVFIIGPSYDPTVLAGLTQAQIADALSNPTSPITQAIVGTANYISAGICSVTSEQPSSVCTMSGVTAASKALGLS